MSTVVVTGSSGFVGRYLVAALKKSGYNVIEVDINIGFDLTLQDCLASLPKFEWIIHLASRSFVPQSFELPFTYYHDNYLSTLQVLETARRIGAKVIYFSSYLYGSPLYLPVNEEHPHAPHNPYAQTKVIGEKLCEGYNRDFQVPVIVFRPFNIYGKGQNASFLIPKILEQMNKGDVILQDPRPKRDFIHVADIVTAVINAIQLNLCGYEIFNLGTGQSISIKHLADIITELNNNDHIITFTNEIRQGEILDSVADITKANMILNWFPKITLKEGLRQIINDSN